MSGLTWFLIVDTVLTVSLVGWLWNARATRREGSARDRFVRSVHDQASAASELDQAALAEYDLPLEVKAHLYEFGLDNPDIADGFARLEQAIRDSRTNKGDA